MSDEGFDEKSLETDVAEVRDGRIYAALGDSSAMIGWYSDERSRVELLSWSIEDPGRVSVLVRVDDTTLGEEQPDHLLGYRAAFMSAENDIIDRMLELYDSGNVLYAEQSDIPYIGPTPDLLRTIDSLGS